VFRVFLPLLDFATQHPAKGRFDKRKSLKIISSELDYF
jgi:hypothetical protein